MAAFWPVIKFGLVHTTNRIHRQRKEREFQININIDKQKHSLMTQFLREQGCRIGIELNRGAKWNAPIK